MPSLSVVQTPPSRRRNEAPALSSPPKPSEPSSSPGTNHLKPTGTSTSLRPRLLRHAVDHAARHQRLADGGVGAPARAVLEQVPDRDREVVVRVHQPAAAGDDAVAVAVGVVAERDVEAILEPDQARHRVRRRAVHADLAVLVDGHERERRIDRVVDDLDRQPVALARSAPSRRRAAPPSGSTPRRRPLERIASMSTTVAQVVDVGRDVVVPVRRRRRQRLAQRSRAGPRGCRRRAARWRPSRSPPVTSVSAGPPWGGLYLKPPSSGGLCDGVITMPSASRSVRPRLCVRIACEITGVGV